MRRPILLPVLLLLPTAQAFAQGFPSAPINWNLPSGGLLDGGITNGYYMMGGTSYGSSNVGSENWSVADMDGDGRLDLVVTAQMNANGYIQEFSPGSNSYWKVYLNTGSGFSTTATNWSLPTGGLLDGGITNGYYMMGGTSYGSSNVGSENWSVADMDGDGRLDLVVTAQMNANGYIQEFSPGSNSYWKVYLNTGSGFSATATNWSLPSGGLLDGGITNGYYMMGGTSYGSSNVGSENWSTADMDGDGRLDLVVTAQMNANGYIQEFSPGSNSYWKVYLNTGSGFSTTATNWSLPSGGLLDGGITYGYQTMGGTSFGNSNVGSENWSTADMDGDGRLDLVVTAQMNANGYIQEFSPGSNSYWKVYLNTGSGFSTTATNWSLPSGGLLDGGITYGYQTMGGTSYGNSNVGSENWSVADMDGDGRLDLMVTAQMNANGYIQEFSPGSNSYWKVYLNSAGTTSMDERYTNDGIHLFPVPADASLNFSSSEEVRILELFDLSGKAVMQQRCSTLRGSIGTERLEPGTYLLRLHLRDSMRAARVIILH